MKGSDDSELVFKWVVGFKNFSATKAPLSQRLLTVQVGGGSQKLEQKVTFPQLTSPPPIVSLHQSVLFMLFHMYKGQTVSKACRNPPLDNSIVDQ